MFDTTAAYMSTAHLFYIHFYDQHYLSGPDVFITKKHFSLVFRHLEPKATAQSRRREMNVWGNYVSYSD